MLQSIKNFAAKFARKKPISKGALPATGQSSVPVGDFGMNDLMNHYSEIAAPFPWEKLELLDLLAVYNPDISKTISDFVLTANTGHSLEIATTKGKPCTAAIDEINRIVSRLYSRSVGADGVINHLLFQVIRTGALSCEACLQPDLSGVKELELVSVKDIRFYRVDNEIKPFQVNHMQDGGRVQLNDITYRYYTLLTLEESPYPIPPLAAAIEPALRIIANDKRVDRIMENMGLLGLNFFKIGEPPPIRGDETPAEMRALHSAHIKRFIDELNEVSKGGFVGIPPDVDPQHFANTSNIKGAAEIQAGIERQLFAGSKSDAGFHGKPITRSETYLYILYKLFLQLGSNVRQIVKRYIEEVYNLHLLLKGINVDGVSLNFKKDAELRPQVIARAKSLETDRVLKLLDKGVISPNTAAQELGYDDYHDEKRIDKKADNLDHKFFRYSKKTNKYELIRPSVNIPGPKIPPKESRLSTDNNSKAEAARKFEYYLSQYLKSVLPYFSELNDDVTDYALDFVMENPQTVKNNPEALKRAIQGYINQHPLYKDIPNKDSFFRKTTDKVIKKIGKEIKLFDDTVFAKGIKPDLEFEFGGKDVEACEFFSQFDNYYFSKFINNEDYGPKIDKFMRDFLARQEGIFGDWTDAAKKEFKRLFGSALDGDLNFQMDRIVSSSVNRIRNYVHTEKLFEAGFEYGIINGDQDTDCKICKPLHGEKILISKVRELIQDFVNMKDTDTAVLWLENSNVTKDDIGRVLSELLEEGRGFPPFHILCKCFLEGYFDNLEVN